MVRYHIPKLTKDGKAFLNIACGTRMSWEWANIDFSPYARLKKHTIFSALLHKVGLLSQERYDKLNRIDPDILHWDVLRRSIPFPDNTFDGIYHCHFIEHVQKTAAEAFLKECLRVLKPGGIMRVVFPDFEFSVKRYIIALNKLHENDKSAHEEHEDAIYDILYQIVTDVPDHNKNEKPFVKFTERIIRGSGIDMGWAHRWMYDRFSMKRVLEKEGFCSVRFLDAHKSDIPDFGKYHLDVDENGTPYYSTGSVYLEARKIEGTNKGARTI
jgi:SAM-dependent methyltransferase